MKEIVPAFRTDITRSGRIKNIEQLLGLGRKRNAAFENQKSRIREQRNGRAIDLMKVELRI